VARVVRGFQVDGFWTALWASLFISVLSLVLGAFVLGGAPEFDVQTSPGAGQGWL
jgi:putative membrane protein